MGTSQTVPTRTISLAAETACWATLYVNGQPVFLGLSGFNQQPWVCDIGSTQQAGLVCNGPGTQIAGESDAELCMAAVLASTNADGSAHYKAGDLTLATNQTGAAAVAAGVPEYYYVMANPNETRQEWGIVSTVTGDTNWRNVESLLRAMRRTNGIGSFKWLPPAGLPHFAPSLQWVSE